VPPGHRGQHGNEAPSTSRPPLRDTCHDPTRTQPSPQLCRHSGPPVRSESPPRQRSSHSKFTDVGVVAGSA
jgi:hypothetical protein